MNRILDILYRIHLGACFFFTVLCLPTAFFPAYADAINNTISQRIRNLLVLISNAFPFSFAECLILLLPLIVFFWILWMRKVKQDKKKLTRVIFFPISALVALFIVVLLPAYNTTTIFEKMDWSEDAVENEEILDATEQLTAGLNDVSRFVPQSDDGTVSPYSKAEINDILLKSYESLSKNDDFDFIKTYKSEVKFPVLSQVMDSAGFTGMFTYFTAEANVSAVIPDCDTPFVMAHEMAHQRGIIREDEANFIAFLVCTNSDDTYVQYSGYYCMLKYLVSAMNTAGVSYSLDLSDAAKADWNAMVASYKEQTTLGKVSQEVNNSWLKASGQSGTTAYRECVRLVVRYYDYLAEKELQAENE